MPQLSSARINRLAKRAENFMTDSVYLLRYTERGTTDEFGTPDISYVQDGPYSCSMNDTRASERAGTAQIDTHDAVLRLPAGTEVDRRDRVKVITRLGQVLVDPSDPLIYQINGEIERGPFGVICPLKLWTGANDE